MEGREDADAVVTDTVDAYLRPFGDRLQDVRRQERLMQVLPSYNRSITLSFMGRGKEWFRYATQH